MASQRSRHDGLTSSSIAAAGVTAPWFAIRGEKLLATGDYEEALGDAVRGIEAYPSELKLYVLRGAALLQLRRDDEALEALQAASDLARLRPRLAEDELALRVNLGIANYRLKRTDAADRHLTPIRNRANQETNDPARRARLSENRVLPRQVPVPRVGGSVVVLIGGARVAAFLNKFSWRNFGSGLTEALENEPTTVAALNTLALVRRDQGRHRESKRLLERSLEVRWDPRIAELLGVRDEPSI